MASVRPQGRIAGCQTNRIARTDENKSPLVKIRSRYCASMQIPPLFTETREDGAWSLSMIPKLIHQTAKTAEIPEKWRVYQKKVRALHPGWGYRLWTDEDNLA